ncbi:DUF5085 family protein [Sporosarcina sp. Marseille-Q4063]|uniref:DUF5085 family protein n=1 Tax=Sporosarcina sp. Marseille-Q4063 TaxID=2810514 RepID=UPI001BAE6ECC|nr:DUF5085 family protein [Sporosarcina sp. Marseille-Q4063]QUW20800.1 DUF5085 family protein [Sporosarcina sp. Marseille-Q4063]
MIVDYEELMYKNVVWHSYEIYYKDFEKALEDFNEKLVKAKLTVNGPLFYGLNNIPRDEIMQVDIYMPVQQSFVAKDTDLNFQSYFYIDNMIMTRITGDFETKTELAYDKLLKYSMENDYNIISPMYHVVRGDDEIQWVELKAKIYSEADFEEDLEEEAEFWDTLLNS